MITHQTRAAPDLKCRDHNRTGSELSIAGAEKDSGLAFDRFIQKGTHLHCVFSVGQHPPVRQGAQPETGLRLRASPGRGWKDRGRSSSLRLIRSWIEANVYNSEFTARCS